MTPERWRQIDGLFQAALEQEPAERAVFLWEVCAADEDLRKEVEYLISCDDQQECLIDAPAFEVAASFLAPNQPELAIGQSVGHYKVLELLGTGGMGEVYLAEDERLRRRIALKLLPADFTVDETRVQRFQQEARSASALNHPNIITIHEIGEFDGHYFIATEFIEGETLRQRIKHARFSSREALDIAIQVAGALMAAHRAGIVHRDIKPENIMVRPDGYIKVLDFGLAKPAGPQSLISGPEASTMDTVNTEPGLLIGTVNYMSPEQARGLNLDARSDIFSLGVVIYEMVTGRSPFEGQTPSDLIASILKVDPPPLAQYSLGLPVELQHITSRALRKEKEERYQTAEALLVDLKGLKRELELGAQIGRDAQSSSSDQTAVITSGPHPAIQTASQPLSSTGDVAAIRTASSAEYIISEIKRHKRGTASAFAIIVLGIAAIPYMLHRPVGKNKSGAGFQNKIRLVRLTSSGNAYGAAISADGRHVAYLMDDAGGQSVWIKEVGTSSNVQIVTPTTVFYQALTFSIDGNYLYCVGQEKGAQESALYQLDVPAGASRKLITGVDSSVTCSPDGMRLAFIRNYPSGESALIVANADGAEEQKLAARNKPAFFWAAAWSPDGKSIACSGMDQDDTNASSIVEIALENGTEKPITIAERLAWIDQIAWLSGGSGLVMNASDPNDDVVQPWQLSYPGGELHRITADFNSYRGVSLAAGSGTLVSTRIDQDISIWIVSDGDASAPKQITFGKDEGGAGIAWSPDDKIVYSSSEGGKREIWTTDADGSNQKQLTFESGLRNYGISVSSDGRYVVFDSVRAGSSNVWRINIDGSNLKQLTSGAGELNPFCSPDGQWVFYSASDSDNKTTRWKVPIDGGDPVRVTGPYWNILGISPDQKLIAYGATEKSGGKKIGIVSSEGGQPVQILDLSPTTMPRRMQWAPDGRAITYIDTRRSVSNIWSRPLDGSPPKPLTDFKTDAISTFAWSHDGKRLACVRGHGTNDIVLIGDIK